MNRDSSIVTLSKSCSILISIILSLICGLFLYSANTPLGPCYGSDNSIYMIMGTALAKGYRPYLDIFDHKGPILFLLQQLPQSIRDGYLTLPIFIQEVFFLFICLRIISRITKSFFAIPDIIPQILYLCFISRMIDEGNLTEEYSNLFSLLAFYSSLHYLHNIPSPTTKQTILTSFILGLCFAINFLIRANNALPVVFFIIGIFFAFLLSRQYGTIVTCAGGFIGGSLAVCLPISVWLIKNNALSAAFQASIIHNLLYSGTTTEYAVGRIRHLLHSDYGYIALFFFFTSAIASICIYHRTKKLAIPFGILFSACGSLIAAFISHKYYYHYLILGAPLAIISCSFLLCIVPSKYRNLIAALILVPCICWLIFQCNLMNTRRINANLDQDQFFSDAEFLASLIPKDEITQVYPYRVEPKWYVAAKILPCNRYYFLQETLADANPVIMDEIVSFFNSTPPKWIVIYSEHRPFNPPYDSRVQYIFESMYQHVATAGDYRLMQLTKATK